MRTVVNLGGTMIVTEVEFEAFVARIEPDLRRALAGHLPVHAVPDAISEAFAFAWEHWTTVKELHNPGGYLFRVAQSRSRRLLEGVLPAPESPRDPDVEPGLPAAFRALPERQRTAAWLVHGCGWTMVEAGEAMNIAASSVATHVSRAMDSLRTAMGVER